MAKGSFEVRLLRSSVKGRRPDPASMAYGDLAINYHHEDPCLAIKGDDNSLIEFKVGVSLTVSATAPLNPKLNDLWWDSTTGRLQLFHLTPPAAAGAWVETSPPVAPPDATDTIKGVVRLADNASISAGTVGRVVDAAQLKAITPGDATEAVKGLVELATAAETTTGTDDTRAVHPRGLRVELDKKADLASPALTGTPTAPTAAAGTSTTQVATTEFVAAAAPDATAATKGLVQLADAAAIAAGTAGRVVDAAQLNAAGRVLKVQHYSNAGTSTNSTSFVNANTGANFLYTPASSNSTLILLATFGTVNDFVSTQNYICTYRIGGPSIVYSSEYQHQVAAGSSGGAGTEMAAIQAAAANTSTAQRTFFMEHHTVNVVGAKVYTVNIEFTVIEVAN